MPDVEGLHDVVESSGAESFDSGLNIVLSANHQHDGVRRNRTNVRQEFQAAHAAHVYVADNKVKALLAQNQQSLLG